MHKHQFPRILKQYLFLLLIVTIVAAIVFGVFMILEQKRFFRVEASSILSYHPEQRPDMISALSIHEVLLIIQNDTVKQQVGDLIAIPQDKQKHLKEALNISYNFKSGSDNLLKVSARWDDADQARQLVEGYIQTAIMAYIHFRTKYLHDIFSEQNKMKTEYEHNSNLIREKLSKLAQSVHGESVKQELETLRMYENQLENELTDYQKQVFLATFQYENLKNTIPVTVDYSKLKIVFQHPYILEIIKKRDEALENYEIQKVLFAETENQVKEAQLKYRFAEDRLNKTLEQLNLMEDEVVSLNTAILKHVEEMETLQTTMDRLNKSIEDVQYRLSQKQKEISAVSDLLPQEVELNKQHRTTLAILDKLENEIMERDKLEMTIKKALVPMNFINVHRLKSFSFPNYILYLLAGIVIITLSTSIFLLENMHRKKRAKLIHSTTKPIISSSSKNTPSTIKP